MPLPEPALEAAYAESKPVDVKVAYEPALLTSTEIRAITDLISENVDQLSAAGLTIESWGVITGGKQFGIWSTSAVEAAADIFWSVMGARIAEAIPRLDVRSSFAFIVSGITPTDREADTPPPYYGGNKLKGPGTQNIQCSSGWGVKSNTNSNLYLTTAWHCYKAYRHARVDMERRPNWTGYIRWHS